MEDLTDQQLLNSYLKGTNDIEMSFKELGEVLSVEDTGVKSAKVQIKHRVNKVL